MADRHHPRGEQRSWAVIVKMTFNFFYCVKYAISLSHKKIQKLQKFYVSHSMENTQSQYSVES